MKTEKEIKHRYGQWCDQIMNCYAMHDKRAFESVGLKCKKRSQNKIRMIVKRRRNECGREGGRVRISAEGAV